MSSKIYPRIAKMMQYQKIFNIILHFDKLKEKKNHTIVIPVDVENELRCPSFAHSLMLKGIASNSIANIILKDEMLEESH